MSSWPARSSDVRPLTIAAAHEAGGADDGLGVVVAVGGVDAKDLVVPAMVSPGGVALTVGMLEGEVVAGERPSEVEGAVGVPLEHAAATAISSAEVSKMGAIRRGRIARRYPA